MTETMRIGTRASALATTQSQLVADQITELTGRKTELVAIATHGDTVAGSLASLGGTGVFVSALRDALLAGRIDVAVHSLKDIPTTPVVGIHLVATPLREDPRDALVARDGLTLGELPPGARVGTGSPRRIAQLRALGLGLELIDIRGNVDTRLGKVATGELDAVILARAGLNRLGRTEPITEVIDPLQVLPAPGQGALAVEGQRRGLGEPGQGGVQRRLRVQAPAGAHPVGQPGSHNLVNPAPLPYGQVYAALRQAGARADEGLP